MPAVTYQFYKQKILPGEGGFMPGSAHDGDTLFGCRIDNFKVAIGELTPAERQQLPKPIRERLSSPASLMEYIARKLEPSNNHGRTSETARHGASAADKQEIEAVKHIVFNFFREEHNTKPGFAQFPQNISNLATDISIHRWHGVANWTVVQAMRDAKILTNAELKEHGIPVMTKEQVVDSRYFKKTDNPYMQRSTAHYLAGELAKAHPIQQDLVEHYMLAWRKQYYEAQIKFENAHEATEAVGQYHERALPGWNKRVDNLIDQPRRNQLMRLAMDLTEFPLNLSPANTSAVPENSSHAAKGFAIHTVWRR